MNYQDLTYVREEKVDGIGPWTWVKTDNGAWDGPVNDWETSHKHEFFKSVRAFDTVVQAGGNLGLYPRLLAERFGQVITFEPDPLNFYCLTMNCQVDNVSKFQAALGNYSGSCGVERLTMENVGMHRIKPEGSIRMIDLDSFVLDSLDLLMLDVEGYEMNILYGAENTINSLRPVVVCENPGAMVCNFLAERGYKVQSQSKSDTVFIPTEA